MSDYAMLLDGMMKAIVSGDSATAEAFLMGKPGLPASAQLAIYAQTYRLRLLQALQATYPALVFLWGEEKFTIKAKGFITENPSRRFNLDSYTPGFAASIMVREKDAFACDLAALEAAIHEVYHDSETLPMEPSWAASQSADALAHRVLRLRSASRLLASAFPLETYYSAFRQGSKPARPEPSQSWLLVLRHRHQVKRLPLEEGEHALLSLLQKGLPLGAALEDEGMAEYVKEKGFAAALQNWFARWVGEGIFRQPE